MSLKIRPDAMSSFIAWQEKMNETVIKFPGFVSLEMRPQEQTGYVEWTLVQRFRKDPDLENWRNSPQRKQLYTELMPLLSDKSQNPLQEINPEIYQGNEDVTEVFVTQVDAANYEAYQLWAAKIQHVEAQFPGYRGVYMQAPERGRGENWITILRFDTPEHLDKWLASKERQTILKEAETIVKALQSHRVVSPFSGWFADITKAKGEAPSVWRQTMLILLVLFPTVMFELKFIDPHLKNINSALSTFILNTIAVTLVTWPLLPIAIRFLNWWLVPGQVHRKQKLIGGTILVLGLYALAITLFWHFL